MMTKAEAIEHLRELLPVGTTIYVIPKHRTPGGTSYLNLYHIKDDNPLWLSRLVSTALDLPFDRSRETLKIKGAGLDLGLYLIGNLSRVLYPGEQLAFHCQWL